MTQYEGFSTIVFLKTHIFDPPQKWCQKGILGNLFSDFTQNYHFLGMPKYANFSLTIALFDNI